MHSFLLLLLGLDAHRKDQAATQSQLLPTLGPGLGQQSLKEP